MARSLSDIRPLWLRRAILPVVYAMLGLAIVAIYAAGTLVIAIWAAIKALGQGPVELVGVLRTEIVPAMRSAWRGDRS